MSVCRFSFLARFIMSDNFILPCAINITSFSDMAMSFAMSRSAVKLILFPVCPPSPSLDSSSLVLNPWASISFTNGVAWYNVSICSCAGSCCSPVLDFWRLICMRSSAAFIVWLNLFTWSRYLLMFSASCIPLMAVL